MAKVVRFHEFGGPEVLRVEEVNVGQPGPGEVRIRVGAIGLNRVEAIFRSGNFGPVTFPSKLGYEAAGVIEALGSDVSGLAVGDRVATLFGLSMEQYGTCGETILFPAEMLVQVPDNQSLAEAAASWMQYGTAYALVGVAGIKPGDHVAITAASSSVGLAAIQIANAHGAVPIAVTRGRDKAAALLEQGAAHVIVSDEENVAARIREITGGRGVRIAFDAVGGPALAGLVSALSPGGIAILYGTLGGSDIDLSAYLLMMPNITLRGFAANALIEAPDSRAEVVDYVTKGIARGAFKPVIDRTFDLSGIADAYRYLEGNAQVGKIVVTTSTAGE